MDENSPALQVLGYFHNGSRLDAKHLHGRRRIRSGNSLVPQKPFHIELGRRSRSCSEYLKQRSSRHALRSKVRKAELRLAESGGEKIAANCGAHRRNANRSFGGV